MAEEGGGGGAGRKVNVGGMGGGSILSSYCTAIQISVCKHTCIRRNSDFDISVEFINSNKISLSVNFAEMLDSQFLVYPYIQEI